MFQNGRQDISALQGRFHCRLSQAFLWWYLRYNAQNIYIKQKYFFFLEGFPLGISVHEVSSTIQSLGWASIPLSVTHLRQLSKVLVASDRYPPKMKFTTSIGVLQVSIADKPQQIQKAAVAVAPTPTRPQIAHAESQSKWPRVEHSSNGTALSSSSMTASSTTRPSTKAPSVSLVSKVTQLESQLGIVSSDVQGLKSNQDTLSQQVVSLGQKQDQGFLDLLQAINSLKAGFEASSSKASPVRKAPKTWALFVWWCCCLIPMFGLFSMLPIVVWFCLVGFIGNAKGLGLTSRSASCPRKC